MARSKKGKKSPGYDFWSRRPKSGRGSGPEAKKMTKRTERAEKKRQIDKAKKDLD